MENGKCHCNEGFKLKGEYECVKNNKCDGGHMENGKCKCPQGKVLKGDKCEPINQCNGGKIVFGVCKCPAGKKQQNGNCVPDSKCKQGEKLVNGICVKQPPKDCPSGIIRVLMENVLNNK